jgi:sugar transferase (PEP-CTERM/EpsH1 system associated)
MRILWLKSDLLLPLDKGGKLRTWHLLRHLARRHDVTYVAFAEPDGSPAEVAGMREVASRVETIPRTEPPKGSMRFYVDAAAHALDPLPYAVGKYRSRAFRRRVATLLAAERFDAIVCDFLPPAVNLPRRLPCPAVLFAHNVEAEIWRRHAETKTGWIARSLYRAQHRRMLRFEQRQLAAFDGVLAVSDADRETFGRLYPGTARQTIHVIPTGVDTEFFAPSIPNPQSAIRNPQSAVRNELVFTGSMDWLPNEDAMRYFCREILPIVRAEEPDARLSIVGRAPTPAVRRLAADHAGAVRVTGRVDDVRPYVRDAAVYIVPLRIGGGTRLKIFEAMAMGKAIVSTTVGAEGLPVTHGEHLLLADEPRAFARDIVRLMRDVDRRRALESAARGLVVERYDWSAVAVALEHALLNISDCGFRIADSANPHSIRNPQSTIRNVEAS